MRILLITTLLLAATCSADARKPASDRAAEDDAKIAKALDGLTPGAPQNCIGQGLGRFRTQVIGRTILYRSNSKLVYRNDTNGGCEGAAYGDALVSRNVTAQVCSGQIIRTVDFNSRATTGSCSLGQFVPYRAQ